MRSVLHPHFENHILIAKVKNSCSYTPLLLIFSGLLWLFNTRTNLPVRRNFVSTWRFKSSGKFRPEIWSGSSSPIGLRMKVLWSIETSAHIKQLRRRNIQEDLKLQERHNRNSRLAIIVLIHKIYLYFECGHQSYDPLCSIYVRTWIRKGLHGLLFHICSLYNGTFRTSDCRPTSSTQCLNTNYQNLNSH
jgi:hypothetical protein